MLKRFFVDNFRPLININFEPARLSLVIGENNSGKTSLMLAMKFFRDTASQPFAMLQSLGSVLSIPNVYLEKDSTQFACTAALTLDGCEYEFDYELGLLIPRAATGRPPSLLGGVRVEREVLRVTGQGFQSTALIENDGDRVRLLNEERRLQASQDVVTEMAAPPDSTMLQKLYEVGTNRLANYFRSYLRTWFFFDFEVRALRSLKGGEFDFILHEDGSNVAAVLYFLKSTQERTYRRIIDAAKVIDPRLHVLNFYRLTPDTVIMVPQDAQGKTLDFFAISGGTLRFLALATALLTLQELPLTFNPAVFIEEPENGIYVGLLKSIMAWARESRAQVVFSSHAPYFIDLFDGESEAIFVLKPGATHSTLHRPDPTRIARLLETMPLGEQHFRGILAR